MKKASAYIGQNWAILHEGNRPDYIKGKEAKTPEEAVWIWRTYRKIYFLNDISARQTTLDEDRALARGLTAKDSPMKPFKTVWGGTRELRRTLEGAISKAEGRA